MAAYDEVDPEDVEALLETRRELGPAYERELVESFTQRVEQAIAQRQVDVVAERKLERRDRQRALSRQRTLAIVSLGTGIPITAIAGSFGEVPGIVAAWIGIVGVNAVHAWQNRH